MKTCVIILDMDTTRRKDVIIMENLTMQELLDMQEQELSKINVGEEITGKVARITNDELTLKLEVGFDGVIPAGEVNLAKGQTLADVYKLDEEVTGVITNVSYKDAKDLYIKVRAAEGPKGTTGSNGRTQDYNCTHS